MALMVSGGDRFSRNAAQGNERNILARLQRSHATSQMYHDLWQHRKTIEAITAHHLGRIDPSACTVQGCDKWLTGQFNVGEQSSPGAVDEKVRAEVATYAWIEVNCPEIPVPCLHGFGLSESLQFTHRGDGAGYTLDLFTEGFDCPYLLLDYIDSRQGNMLSDTFRNLRETDSVRMKTLLRGISRIMLSLARKTHSRIGSLRFNDDCSVTLANRPLFYCNSILESEGAPRTVARTYTTSGSFIDDMLKFRREAFTAQPNAANDEEDCRLQMAHMLMLELLRSQFVDLNSEGPFVLQFTDFHASNIFVDDDWNVVAIIDLEFVCALSAAMTHVPYWLSVDAIDQIGPQMDRFDKMHATFMETFRDEEQTFSHAHSVQLASAMQEAWTSYAFWFYCCLTCVNGIDYFFEEHIYQKFNFSSSLADERKWLEQMSSIWPTDSKSFVKQKLEEKARYNEDLARHFESNVDAGAN